jgi:hypothetical protein
VGVGKEQPLLFLWLYDTYRIQSQRITQTPILLAYGLSLGGTWLPRELGVMVHTVALSTQEAEAEGSQS